MTDFARSPFWGFGLFYGRGSWVMGRGNGSPTDQEPFKNHYNGTSSGLGSSFDSGSLPGSNAAPQNGAGYYDVDDQGSFDWTEGFSGSVNGYVEGSGENDFGSFGSSNLNDLEFAFRAEIDEGSATQPSGAGWYVDNVEVDAVARTPKLSFTPTDAINSVATPNCDADASGLSPTCTAGIDNDALEGFNVDDSSAYGWVQFTFEDQFGQNVAEGAEAQLDITDSSDGNNTARFVSVAENGGSNLQVSNNGHTATVETNTNGEVTVLIRNTESESRVVV